MRKTSDHGLNEISRQEKEYDSMYRQAAACFNMSDCTMWVMYFLSSSEKELSQQDLLDLMMFPKQTINSAVKSLVEKGFVDLEVIPWTRNKKKIILTAEGRILAEKTVLKMRKAEIRAAEAMGDDRIRHFIELYNELFDYMNEEFRKEGIING